MQQEELAFTGERVVPWALAMRGWSWVLQHHLARYTWALPMCTSQSVVDLGCGTGYGSYIMSWLAKEVLGLEIDLPAVHFAEDHFGDAPNIQFRPFDLETDALPVGTVYTCFECLEHLRDPQSLLRQIADVAPNAIVMGSVPLGDPNRFHQHVFSTLEDVYTYFGWPTMERQYFIQDNNGQIFPWPSQVDFPKYVLFLAKASVL